MENVLHTVAPLLPSLVHSSSPGRPTYLPPEARSQPQHGVIWSARDKPTSGRDVGRREAVEKSPHPPHQYCSFTWWKLTLANIFHRVIGREDRMPWLDMPTLLPVQMMTHRLLHYSWLLQRRGRRWEKSVESNWRSRARWSTSRSRSGSDGSMSASSRWREWSPVHPKTGNSVMNEGPIWPESISACAVANSPRWLKPISCC